MPEVYAKAIAHYATPAKAFLDALRRGRRAPTPVGHPRRGEALAAHRLVDGAYRSAASGGGADPIGVRRR